MVEVQNYSLKGDYHLQGSIYRQSGQLSFVERSLLYGHITDFQSDRPGLKRVIGVRSSARDKIALLKLPDNLFLCPVVWYLSPVKSRQSQRDSLSGGYTGIWGVSEGMPILVLQNALDEVFGSEPFNKNNLKGWNDLQMEDAFFGGSDLPRIEEECRRRGQVGSLSLERV